jgi:hypothetical protein
MYRKNKNHFGGCTHKMAKVDSPSKNQLQPRGAQEAGTALRFKRSDEQVAASVLRGLHRAAQQYREQKAAQDKGEGPPVPLK